MYLIHALKAIFIFLKLPVYFIFGWYAIDEIKVSAYMECGIIEDLTSIRLIYRGVIAWSALSVLSPWKLNIMLHRKFLEHSRELYEKLKRLWIKNMQFNYFWISPVKKTVFQSNCDSENKYVISDSRTDILEGAPKKIINFQFSQLIKELNRHRNGLHYKIQPVLNNYNFLNSRYLFNFRPGICIARRKGPRSFEVTLAQEPEEKDLILDLPLRSNQGINLSFERRKWWLSWLIVSYNWIIRLDKYLTIY